VVPLVFSLSEFLGEGLHHDSHFPGLPLFKLESGSAVCESGVAEDRQVSSFVGDFDSGVGLDVHHLLDFLFSEHGLVAQVEMEGAHVLGQVAEHGVLVEPMRRVALRTVENVSVELGTLLEGRRLVLYFHLQLGAPLHFEAFLAGDAFGLLRVVGHE